MDFSNPGETKGSAVVGHQSPAIPGDANIFPRPVGIPGTIDPFPFQYPPGIGLDQINLPLPGGTAGVPPALVPPGFVSGSRHRQPTPVGGGPGSPNLIVNPVTLIAPWLTEELGPLGLSVLIQDFYLHVDILAQGSIPGVSRKQNLSPVILIKSPVNLPVGPGPFHLSVFIETEQVVLL